METERVQVEEELALLGSFRFGGSQTFLLHGS